MMELDRCNGSGRKGILLAVMLSLLLLASATVFVNDDGAVTDSSDAASDLPTVDVYRTSDGSSLSGKGAILDGASIDFNTVSTSTGILFEVEAGTPVVTGTTYLKISGGSGFVYALTGYMFGDSEFLLTTGVAVGFYTTRDCSGEPVLYAELPDREVHEFGSGLESGVKYYIQVTVLNSKTFTSAPNVRGVGFSFTIMSASNVNAVYFNDGFGNVTEKLVTNGTVWEFPPVSPASEGYTFLGWYTLPVGGDYIEPGSIVKLRGDTYLYAHWWKGGSYHEVIKTDDGCTVVIDVDVSDKIIINIEGTSSDGVTTVEVEDFDASNPYLLLEIIINETKQDVIIVDNVSYTVSNGQVVIVPDEDGEYHIGGNTYTAESTVVIGSTEYEVDGDSVKVAVDENVSIGGHNYPVEVDEEGNKVISVGGVTYPVGDKGVEIDASSGTVVIGDISAPVQTDPEGNSFVEIDGIKYPVEDGKVIFPIVKTVTIGDNTYKVYTDEYGNEYIIVDGVKYPVIDGCVIIPVTGNTITIGSTTYPVYIGTDGGKYVDIGGVTYKIVNGQLVLVTADGVEVGGTIYTITLDEFGNPVISMGGTTVTITESGDMVIPVKDGKVPWGETVLPVQTDPEGNQYVVDPDGNIHYVENGKVTAPADIVETVDVGYGNLPVKTDSEGNKYITTPDGTRYEVTTPGKYVDIDGHSYKSEDGKNFSFSTDLAVHYGNRHLPVVIDSEGNMIVTANGTVYGVSGDGLTIPVTEGFVIVGTVKHQVLDDGQGNQYIDVNGVIYPVVDGKVVFPFEDVIYIGNKTYSVMDDGSGGRYVEIDGTKYPVKDGKVVFPIEDDTVTIGNKTYDVYDEEGGHIKFPVINERVVIGDVTYPVEKNVTIDDKVYPVVDDKLIIPAGEKVVIGDTEYEVTERDIFTVRRANEAVSIYDAVDQRLSESGLIPSADVWVTEKDNIYAEPRALGILYENDMNFNVHNGDSTLTFSPKALQYLEAIRIVDGRIVIPSGSSYYPPQDVEVINRPSLDSDMTEAQKAAIGDSVSRTYLVLIDGVEVRTFGGGEVTISFGFTPSLGSNSMLCFWVKENGSMVDTDASYYNGRISFVSTHLSIYCVKEYFGKVDYIPGLLIFFILSIFNIAVIMILETVSYPSGAPVAPKKKSEDEEPAEA